MIAPDTLGIKDTV